MAKNKEHRRPEAIPLPDTLRDALSRPSKDAPYVSHSVKVEGENGSPENSELTSDNHAFYVGKMVPYSFGEKVRKLLGWGEVNGRIYTPEVIEGLLNYAAQHLKEGEKAHFVVAPELSELFNGPEDIKRALTAEKEIELIRKIAGGEFFNRFGTMPLSVTAMEEDALHKDLFGQLRSSIDPETKVVDPKKAFENEKEIELSENASSLQIAQLLYKVAQEDDRFAEALEHAVPGRFKRSDNTQYYALTEVGIRLAEILKGRNVHGGAERQGVYDIIIERILKGKKGSYKHVKSLEPLFKLFEGKRFETIHLKTKENYYEMKKKRNLARWRVLLMLALAGGATSGAYEYGRYRQREEQKENERLVNDDLKKALANEILRIGSGPTSELNRKYNVQAFNEIVNKALDDIGSRYQLQDSILDEIRPLLQKHFLEYKGKISTIYGGNNFLRIDLEDSFIRKNALIFKSRGIQVKKPYENLYPYLKDFKALLESGDDFVADDRERQTTLAERGMEDPDKKEFEYIGAFYSGESGWYDNNKYEFYWYSEEDGKKHLVAKCGTKTYHRHVAVGSAGYDTVFEYNVYSTKRAKEGIRQFLYSIKRFDAVGLMEHESLLADLNQRRDYEKPEMLCRGLSEKARYIEMMGVDVGAYKDYFGGFEYEFVVWHDFDKRTFVSKPCLLAKKPNELEFTDKRAQEMAGKYHDMDSAWYDFSHGRYIEEKLPLDLEKMNSEIQAALSIARHTESMIAGSDEKTKKLNEQISYIRNVAGFLMEGIAKADGTYESNETIISGMEHLEELYKELMKMLDDTLFTDRKTGKLIDPDEISREFEINAGINAIIGGTRSALSSPLAE